MAKHGSTYIALDSSFFYAEYALKWISVLLVPVLQCLQNFDNFFLEKKVATF